MSMATTLLARDLAARLRLPAVVGFVLVLPFILLEAINSRGFAQGFPLVLFAILWFLPTAFALVVRPIMRNARAGTTVLARPASLVLSVAGLALIAWAWGSIVADQLPCFLGVPNCD